jgi:hypothetical protein
MLERLLGEDREKGHTRGRRCKARRAQTGLSASRGRKSSPCKDRSRGSCSAGKMSDATRTEHCVRRRQQQATTQLGRKVWDMGGVRETHA